MPAEVKDKMQFAFVRTVEEALDEAFGRGRLGWRGQGGGGREMAVMESRL